jgi:xanthosine utilization system XapX-like protein
MKKLILSLGFITLGLVVFNFFHVDFAAPFEGDSIVALVGIVAGLCAIVLLALMWVAKAIQDKVK